LGDRKVKRIKVETGIRQDGKVEILSGLKAGQQVVTEGVVKLSDGITVRLAGDKPAPSSKRAG